LRIWEKSVRADHPDMAMTLNNLALVHEHQGRFAAAEPLYQRAIRIYEKRLGSDHPSLATTLTNLADLYAAQAKYVEAVSLYQRAVQIREKSLGPDHPDLAVSLNNLAHLYISQGKYAEVEPLLQRALKIWEKSFGPDYVEVATALSNLASFFQDHAKYAEAEPLLERSLRIREKALGPDHPEVAVCLNNLAELYRAQAEYDRAEPLFERSLKIIESRLGPHHIRMATGFNNLALLYDNQGKYAQAEPLYRRSLDITERAFGPEHPDVALRLSNLATLHAARGQYSEAEPLHRRALQIREKAFGPDHPDVASSLNNLASLLIELGKYSEAQPLFERSLRICEATFGPDHPDVAIRLDNLAQVHEDQGNDAEAGPLYQRAVRIREKALGPNHPDVAISVNNLAHLYKGQGKYGEAETLYQRSLRICERSLGPDHPEVATRLINLAYLYRDQGKRAEMEPLVDRVIRIRDRAGVAPDDRYNSYLLRARLSWDLDRRGEAVDDLEEAMRLAEEQRVHAAGGARERAEAFGEFAAAFEQMVAWQVERKDVAKAVNAIERSRARTLLDDMLQAGSDIHAGRSVLERKQLHQEEQQLRQQVATLETQLQGLDRSDERFAATEEKLAAARAALYEHDRNMRLSSPVYRNLLSIGSGPPGLSRLQRRLLEADHLLLLYLLGDKGGYVVAITPGSAVLTPLVVSDAAAAAFPIDAGPLTAKRLQSALMSEDGTGLVERLSKPESTAAETSPALAALWETLVPEAIRTPLRDGMYKRLIVIPDGPLALLPFETLVVAMQESGEPTYLLDVGPPIQYAPSATVLYNLLERQPSHASSGVEPLLTVGDPVYLPASKNDDADLLADLAPRARFGRSGQRLEPLPNSRLESAWVTEAFQHAQISGEQLLADAATEAKVREAIAGRRIVHLACHGLVDQEYGNFFGALALTPGQPAGNSGDDGFLTLLEIYGLDLQACELAILSACQTNFGPRQRGEGVWALSRGFLVAGARRVVATNWLVDDEGAATLVNYFCTDIAQQEAQQADRAVDYAQALQTAKRRVREEPKWSSPYYWAPFVLVGPD
jgi:tetratricopeptide (TPR) repeat protein/CHAT domain-containing protein